MLQDGLQLKPNREYYALRGPNDDGFTSPPETARMLEEPARPITTATNDNRNSLAPGSVDQGAERIDSTGTIDQDIER
jgi:hypothetical protein